MESSVDLRIDRFHASGIVDMHFDLPLDLYDRRHQRGLLRNEFVPELRAGGVGLIGAALFIEDRHLPEMGLRVALDQIARLYEEAALAVDDVTICRSYADIVQARAAGKIGVLITMEGVEPLGTDLHLLRVFYELAVRSLGLTHARRNAAGDGGVFAPSGSSPAGLSPFGKAVVQECQRLGILLDLAHLNPAGTDDVLALTDGPLIISHTNPRRFHDIERNTSDAHLRAVGERGGVIGVNAVLLSSQKEMATIDHYVDHIIYIADLAGIDAVGIGFDFIEFLFRHWTPEQQAAVAAAMIQTHQPPGLTNHSHARNLTRRLIERGFHDEEIEKVLYRNWLRVLQAVIG
ncbi:MAG: membrane dipeptidase [Chloroflexota bacterium]|nr:dipeptidase [Caldilinea sp.]GIK73158.1 MAG: membrane dipeptidase [Chloroflexota bacterium]